MQGLLFDMEDNQLIISPFALMTEPFNEIWDADSDPDKLEAVKIFKYIELTCNPKKNNPFSGYSEQERPAKVKKNVFGDENPALPIDMINDILRGTIKYKEFLTEASPSYGLYIDAANSVVKLRKFLREFDLDQRTNSGGMVLKPQDIATTLGKLDDVDKSMIKAREKVHNEISDNTRTRNSREIGLFER